MQNGKRKEACIFLVPVKGLLKNNNVELIREWGEADKKNAKTLDR